MTLGPTGTDAYTEASKIFRDVILAETFPEAMTRAHEEKHYALVAAGYIERTGNTGNVSQSWVDIHFQWLGEMHISAIWESPTKEMCLAFNHQKVRRLEDVRTVAIHPSTETLARKILPDADYTYTRAKPIAVECAANGLVDACLGSRDIVQQNSSLTIHKTLHPTMVWCLYKP
ncbi:hypothetical protein ACM01_17765 [Streptomyces viridochromogenes]|uniref:Prephenate dehydratase n=1 Tax=Streptomyces viridochromogenes TaxID=1938 RepID=A0A0J7ZC07_STRVR|nr:hypothetical protein ACM01_17765 [Streptomyces viridochromogenes]KOG07903.1 hypothetical protein ADK36_44100 [Streptomyces viridochromogenes]KOG28339.1 hypothetical protein ADK35_03755 [Streptomyces viridochromogenes]